MEHFTTAYYKATRGSKTSGRDFGIRHEPDACGERANIYALVRRLSAVYSYQTAFVYLALHGYHSTYPVSAGEILIYDLSGGADPYLEFVEGAR